MRMLSVPGRTLGLEVLTGPGWGQGEEKVRGPRRENAQHSCCQLTAQAWQLSHWTEI